MIMSAMNGRKVLFVEDSLTMRRIIANSLKQVGFDNIIEAENGADAIEMSWSPPGACRRT
jgi:two-component system chemotaxis response regulator CheY